MLLMKLKFDPNQQFQIDAISAVTNLFDGQPLSESDLEIGFQRKGWIFQNELGIGNRLTLGDSDLLKNVQSIQKRNGIEITDFLQGRHFSVEWRQGQVRLMYICALSLS